MLRTKGVDHWQYDHLFLPHHYPFFQHCCCWKSWSSQAPLQQLHPRRENRLFGKGPMLSLKLVTLTPGFEHFFVYGLSPDTKRDKLMSASNAFLNSSSAAFSSLDLRTGGCALCSTLSFGVLKNVFFYTNSYAATLWTNTKRKRRNKAVRAATSPESLYNTLSILPTATDKEIKQAYRKLALKYHPDVNKEPDAQERFMRVKQAYQTLVDPRTRSKYDASRRYSNRWDEFSWESSASSRKGPNKEEEFYGLEDFFHDLQADLQERQTSTMSGKPKSLWEELAEIGEEFVEFLEKELNIVDETSESIQNNDRFYGFDLKQGTKSESHEGGMQNGAQEDWNSKLQNDVKEIEDMLAQLKKELGL